MARSTTTTTSTIVGILGVHATRSGLLLLGATLVAGLLLGSVSIDRIAFITFDLPIPALHILPALAGAAAGIGCVNLAAGLPAIDPPRAKVARLGLALGWLTAATGASAAGSVAGSATSLGVIVRNVAIHAALALVTVALGQARLVWLPSLSLLLGSMLFGYSTRTMGFAWWAVLLEERVTVGQVAAVGMVYAAALILHVARAAPASPVAIN